MTPDQGQHCAAGKCYVMNIKAIISSTHVVLLLPLSECCALQPDATFRLCCFVFVLLFFLHDLREQPGRWAPNVPPSEAVMEGTAKNRRTVALLRMRAVTVEGLG